MMDLYDSQRSMRNMRRIAMQRGVVAILDVGSSKIACLWPLRPGLVSPCPDAKQLGGGQQFAIAAWPELGLSGRQAAERWPALCHCGSARTRLAGAPGSSVIARLCPLLPGLESSCGDAKQL